VNLNDHWKRVDSGERGIDWRRFTRAIGKLAVGQLWRHNQAGDLPGRGSKINRGMLEALVKANQGKRGFTYTHKPMATKSNRLAVQYANQNGFTVNLSANSPMHADVLADLGIAPVAAIVPTGTAPVSYTPAGRKIVVCPAQQRDDVTCQTCGLCSHAKRSVIVGFLPHGNMAKLVNSIACNT